MTRTSWDVALIIPFLNAERTLAETLDSVVAQTYFDRIHTIVVDNDSIDDSPEIAARYAALHPNIEVVHHIGGGCGGARNRALQLVQEPYVAFLDADDVLKPESIQVRLDMMVSTGADLVLGAVETFPEVRPYTPLAVYGQDRVVGGLAADMRIARIANVTANLFTREFFADPANHFPENMPFEDVPVTSAAMALAKRIAVSSFPGYRYRKDPTATTIMTTALIKPTNYRDHLRINAMVFERFRDDPIATEALGHLLIRTILAYVDNAPERLNDAELEEFVTDFAALYGNYSLDQIHEHVPLLAQSLPFYAALTGDAELLRDPKAHITGFAVIDDVPGIDLDRPVVPAFRRLIEFRKLRIWGVGSAEVALHAATSTAGHIQLQGTITQVRAGEINVELPKFNFGLRIGQTDVSVPLSLDQNPDGSWTWSAKVDPQRVPAGKHRLSFIADPWAPQDRYPIMTAATFEPAPHVQIKPGKSGRGTHLKITSMSL